VCRRSWKRISDSCVRFKSGLNKRLVEVGKVCGVPTLVRNTRHVRAHVRGRGKEWAERSLGLSVEDVYRSPKPMPEKVLFAWARELHKEERPQRRRYCLRGPVEGSKIKCNNGGDPYFDDPGIVLSLPCLFYGDLGTLRIIWEKGAANG